LKNNSTFLIKILKEKKDPTILKYASLELLDNMEFIIQATKIEMSAFAYASNELQNNVNFLIKILKETENGLIFEYVNPLLVYDREIILAFYKYSLNAVYILDDKFCDDIEVIYYFVKSIQYHNENVNKNDFYCCIGVEHCNLNKFIPKKYRNMYKTLEKIENALYIYIQHEKLNYEKFGGDFDLLFNYWSYLE
jgi:hypothetical protein